MRNYSKFFFYALFFLLTFGGQSCTHYYYGPNSCNVPLLEKKDDVRIAAAIASADETTGFELQTAYAFSNHFGGMFNFYWTRGEDQYNPSGSETYEKGTGVYAEFGGGYFTPLHKSRNWIFETYAGGGTGAVSNTYIPTETSKVSATKIFIQPSIGYANDAGTFHAAVASRFSSVNLKLKSANVTANKNPEDYGQIQDIKADGKNIYWEPSLVLRAGFNKIMFQLQVTRSTPLKNKEYFTQSSVISLGLIFGFNAKTVK